MAYEKNWLSYEDQLNQLELRGLRVTDRPKALEYLKRIGYYRLSGYWYAFRELSELCCPLESRFSGKQTKKAKTTKLVLEPFLTGSTFDQAVRLYVFDKKLRLLVMDALERIEIAFRVDIAHVLGKHDPFAYLRANLLFSGFSEAIDKKTGVTEHHIWLGKQATLINRSKEEFILHNKSKYGLPLPIWIACEVWDFGTLSTLFGGM
jgi:abortive infection bacteriophage resistance protein